MRSGRRGQGGTMRKISVSIAMLALTAGYVTPASARLHNSPWFERFGRHGIINPPPSSTPTPVAPKVAPTPGPTVTPASTPTQTPDPNPTPGPKATSTPTPDPTPTAQPTPAGNYGAGGTPLPQLNNPHTYNCVGGDNSSGLQAALNAPGDVLISGSSCNINRE